MLPAHLLLVKVAVLLVVIVDLRERIKMWQVDAEEKLRAARPEREARHAVIKFLAEALKKRV
jgi:hypothetical protein